VISITVESRDMYALARSLARSYSHTDKARVTDEDIGAAYSAACSLPYLFCPIYLIQETRALRDEDVRQTVSE